MSLSVSLSLFLFLFIYLSLSLSLALSFYISIYLPIYKSIYLSVYFYLYSFIYLNICRHLLYQRGELPGCDCSFRTDNNGNGEAQRASSYRRSPRFAQILFVMHLSFEIIKRILATIFISSLFLSWYFSGFTSTRTLSAPVIRSELRNRSIMWYHLNFLNSFSLFHTFNLPFSIFSSILICL